MSTPRSFADWRSGCAGLRLSVRARLGAIVTVSLARDPAQDQIVHLGRPLQLKEVPCALHDLRMGVRSEMVEHVSRELRTDETVPASVKVQGGLRTPSANQGFGSRISIASPSPLVITISRHPS